LVAETVIEYPHLVQMGLGMRWLNTVVSAIITVHMLNTSAAFKKLAQKKAAPEGAEPGTTATTTTTTTTSDGPGF
jgi:hypothetical protein